MEILRKINISVKKNFRDDVSRYLMSGKSHSDENFPVASFLMTKIRSIIRVFYFLLGWSDDIADHQNLSSNQKEEIIIFWTMLFQKVRRPTTRFSTNDFKIQRITLRKKVFKRSS